MPRVNTLTSINPNLVISGTGEFYSFSANTTSVNEGNTALFTVSTRNVSETTLYWTIVAVSGTFNSLDTDSLSGSFNLTSNVGSFAITLLEDSSTEGTEIFQVQLRKNSISGTIVANSSFIIANDTSLLPLYTLTANTTSVNEGNTVSFSVDTENVANGTVLYWTTLGVSGTINSSDFSDSQTEGTITINNNFVSFNRTLSDDVTTEGTESFRIQLRTSSNTGTIVANSATVTIADTSVTPPPTGQVIFQVSSDLGEQPTDTSVYRRSITTSWTVPEGVTSISVVCIGAGGGGKAYGTFTKPGGGGGGALSYRNNIAVTPGETLGITYGYGIRDRGNDQIRGSCSTIWRGTAFASGSTLLCGASGGRSATESGDGIANGLGGPGGLRFSHNISNPTQPGLESSQFSIYEGNNDGGGAGGNGGTATSNIRAAGGGGAGGYAGQGGAGGTSTNGSSGAGGAGGGGGSGTNTGGPGGGTSPYGQQSNGAGGIAGTDGTAGGGGTISNYNGQDWPLKGYAYGGGGGSEIRDGIWSSNTEGAGGKGCIRIIWPGDARQFPSTRTVDE